MIRAKQVVKEYIDDVLKSTIEEFKARYREEYFLASYSLNPGGASMIDKTQVSQLERPRQKWVVDENDIVYPLDLSQGWLWIGRGQGCDLILLEPGVSELQARLAKKERELFLIPYEKATNSSYLDGKLVKEPTKVEDRSIIAFGSHQYTLYSKGGFYLAVKTFVRLKKELANPK